MTRFLGRADAAIFDPKTESWSFAAKMAHGRWYPSLITLGDGSCAGGHRPARSAGERSQSDARALHACQQQLAALAFQAGVARLPLYAHLFLLEDGQVFFNGGHMDDDLDLEPCLIDLTHAPVAVEPIFGINARDMRSQSASVLLPPAQEQRVMLMGGGPEGKQTKPTRSTTSISSTFTTLTQASCRLRRWRCPACT